VLRTKSGFQGLVLSADAVLNESEAGEVSLELR